MKMHRTIGAGLIAAMMFGASAQAVTVRDLIVNAITNNGTSSPDRNAFLEDDNGSIDFTVFNGGGPPAPGDLVVGIVNIQSIARGNNAGPLNSTIQSSPSFSTDGNNVSLQGLIVALLGAPIVDGPAAGFFQLVPLGVAGGVDITGDSVDDIFLQNANSILQIYVNDTTIAEDITGIYNDDVTGVFGGAGTQLVAEFGFDNPTNFYYVRPNPGPNQQLFQFGLDQTYTSGYLPPIASEVITASALNGGGVADLYGGGASKGLFAFEDLDDDGNQDDGERTTWEIADGDFVVHFVPTPAALWPAMATFGAFAAGFRRRSSRKAQQA